MYSYMSAYTSLANDYYNMVTRDEANMLLVCGIIEWLRTKNNAGIYNCTTLSYVMLQIL